MKKGQQSTTKDILKIFGSHLGRYKKLTGLVLSTIIAATIIDIIVPWFYKRFFDALTSSNGPTDAIAQTLIQAIIIIASLHFLSWAFWRVIGFTVSYLQARVMADLQQTSFNHLIHHSHRFFANSFAGSLVRKVNRLARSFEDISDQVQFNLIPLIITVIGIITVLFFRHQTLAIALAIWTAIFIIINLLLARWKQKYDIKKAETDSETTAVMADAIANTANINFFSGHHYEKLLYKKATEKLRKIRTFAWRLHETTDATQAIFMIAIEFLLFYFAIQFWKDGLLTIGDFALIQAYLVTLFHRLWTFGRIVRRLYEGFADATEMVEILNTPHEIQDSKSAKPLKVPRGAINFQNVYFSFQKTRRILEKFNLKIQPGEKVALVGPSGAGKTTIAALILRLYDLEHGRILIDNQDIAKVIQKTLRENISFVPQEPVLFHRTIAENIRYGKLNASKENIIEAAKKAHCHEFIGVLPQGYDTYVGERGIKLSGGERQRIAIARAILKNAPILILDEATSSLDSYSESLIQDALKELMKDKTAIVIAHRLSTIMQMDRIIVIDGGKVVISGAHQELLQKTGIYKKLWQIQAGGFIP